MSEVQMPKEYDKQKAVEGTTPDPYLEETTRKITANEETMNKVFQATKQTFKALYGEEPDLDGQVWKWYLTEVFPNNHRLALTGTKQDVK